MEAEPLTTPGRDPEAGAAIARRLARIEGQVRALRARVEADAYCMDLARDLAAIRSALDHVGGEIVARHLRTCVVGQGAGLAHPGTEGRTGEELAAELGGMVARLMR